MILSQRQFRAERRGNARILRAIHVNHILLARGDIYSLAREIAAVERQSTLARLQRYAKAAPLNEGGWDVRCR